MFVLFGPTGGKEQIMKKYSISEMGQRIRDLRIAAGYTQEKLAETMGTHSSYFHYIEAAKKNCPVELLVELSNLFDVSLDYLICGESGKETINEQTLDNVISQLQKLRENI